MKKLILTLSFILMFSQISFGYDREISVENNLELTNTLGYPVMDITNKSDSEILVEYDYYKNVVNNKYDHITAEIKLSPNESKTIHLKELAFLGKKGDTRRVWFNWNLKGVLKPKDLTIDTVPFTSPNHPQLELG